MDLNIWKQTIKAKYDITIRELKRIRQDELYNSTQYLIDYYTCKGNQSIVYELNEFINQHYKISDHHIRLQELRNDRVQWLKVYTNNNRVTDSEYYRQLAFKCIHNDYHDEDIQQLIEEVLHA